MANTLFGRKHQIMALASLAFAVAPLLAESRARAEDLGVPCPANVPAAVDPPAGVTLERGLRASGVQIYECSAEKGSAPSWVLRAPHALLTSGEAIVGIHYNGPVWQGLDGSTVRGTKVGSVDAPAPDAVPWLSLSGEPTETPSGAGTFGRVTFVQRLETSGGKAPSAACQQRNRGEKVLVPYTSSYFFYRKASSGDAVEQCSSNAGKRKH